MKYTRLCNYIFNLDALSMTPFLANAVDKAYPNHVRTGNNKLALTVIH